MQGKLILWEALGWFATGSGVYSIFAKGITFYTSFILLTGLILIVYSWSERKRLKKDETYQKEVKQ